MSDYIPPELIPNILARLSVDDVLRCTSVCKSWYVLITSSSFISLHLKLSTPNQESRLLVKFLTLESGICCKVYRDCQTIDELAELQCPAENLFRIIGSINGLLCFSYPKQRKSRQMRISLWNPSLRKSFTLPDRVCDIFDDVSVGFGFLPQTNDYKVVRLLQSHRYNNALIQVEIYELSTNSWRNVSVGQVSYCSFNYEPAVFVKSSLHWRVSIRHDNDSGQLGRSIASFDLKNENLGALSVPKCLDNDESDFEVSAVKESLCLIHYTHTHYDKYYDIWVMNEYGVLDSWTMQFRIEKGDYRPVGPLNFRENGEIILHGTKSTSPKGYLVSCDLTTDQVMNIGKYEEYSYNFIVTTYMESLVLIKGTNRIL